MNSRTWPTLYKMSSKGATQQWTIEAFENADGTAAFKVTHGQKDGRMQQTETAVKVGKNIGRANETTPFRQACAEAESKWRKRLDEGYGESVEVAKPERKPMLAHDYAKHRDKVKFPAWMQPKLDGIRCLATKEDGVVSLVSRMNKPIETVKHINQALADVMEDGETWDGELFIKGVDFQTLSSWIKREQEGSGKVEYHVYDCVKDGPFEDRYTSIFNRIGERHWSTSQLVIDPPKVHGVTTVLVESHEDITKNHAEFVAQGYEGGMVRHDECPYKTGYRSSCLLKVKSFMDGDYPIVGVSEGKGKFEGFGILRLVTPEGAEFDCLPKGDEATRRGYWENRDELIGKTMTVRFFELTTSEKPVPRFPIGIAVRWDV